MSSQVPTDSVWLRYLGPKPLMRVVIMGPGECAGESRVFEKGGQAVEVPRRVADGLMVDSLKVDCALEAAYGQANFFEVVNGGEG